MDRTIRQIDKGYFSDYGFNFGIEILKHSGPDAQNHLNCCIRSCSV
jgi:hypothetical protein